MVDWKESARRELERVYVVVTRVGNTTAFRKRGHKNKTLTETCHRRSLTHAVGAERTRDRNSYENWAGMAPKQE